MKLVRAQGHKQHQSTFICDVIFGHRPAPPPHLQPFPGDGAIYDSRRESYEEHLEAYRADQIMVKFHRELTRLRATSTHGTLTLVAGGVAWHSVTTALQDLGSDFRVVELDCDLGSSQFKVYVVFEGREARSIFLQLAHPSAIFFARQHIKKRMAMLNDMANALLHTLASNHLPEESLFVYRDLLYPSTVNVSGYRVTASEVLRELCRRETQNKVATPVEQIPQEVLDIYPEAVREVGAATTGARIFPSTKTILRLILANDRRVARSRQFSDLVSKQVRERWAKTSRAERDRHIKRWHDGNKAWYAQMTASEKKNCGMKGLIAIKAWRESIELEENAAEKEAWLAKQSVGTKWHWQSMSKEEWDAEQSKLQAAREATEDALRRTIVPGLDFEVNALAARSIKCQQATTRSQSRLDDSFPPPEDKYNLLGRDELLKRIRDFFLCGANVALNREFTVFGVQAVKAMRAEDVTVHGWPKGFAYSAYNVAQNWMKEKLVATRGVEMAQIWQAIETGDIYFKRPNASGVVQKVYGIEHWRAEAKAKAAQRTAG